MNGKEGGSPRQYPSALASHNLVLRDPVAFWDTLRRFHFFMGTKFM